jgi:hypothetical protein
MRTLKTRRMERWRGEKKGEQEDGKKNRLRMSKQ